MGLLSRIFSSPDAITETVQTVSKGLDALVYTAEEKAQDAAKDRSEARGMLVQWMTATSGQNVARRWLAIAITSVWLGQYVFAMLFSIGAIWFAADTRAQMLATSAVIADYAENMNGAVMLILGFFFAAPHLDKIVGPALERFGRAKTATPTAKE